MRPELLPAIEALKGDVGALEAKLSEAKAMTNRMCDLAGVPHVYADVGSPARSGVGTTIQADQFYGKSLGTAAREYLEIRKAAGLGPAAPREIYEALAQGGAQFETKNEENAITGVRGMLRKNSSIFHRLPNNQYGLLVWYPNAKAAKAEEDEPDTSRRRKASATRSMKGHSRKAGPDAPKSPKRHGNQKLADFVVTLLEDGRERSLDQIRKEAIAVGGLEVDAKTSLRSLHGLMLSLLRQGRLRSQGSGIWKANPSSQSEGETTARPFKPAEAA